MTTRRIKSLVAAGTVVVTCGLGASALAPSAMAAPTRQSEASELAAPPALDAFRAGVTALAAARAHELSDLSAAITAEIRRAVQARSAAEHAAAEHAAAERAAHERAARASLGAASTSDDTPEATEPADSSAPEPRDGAEEQGDHSDEQGDDADEQGDHADDQGDHADDHESSHHDDSGDHAGHDDGSDGSDGSDG